MSRAANVLNVHLWAAGDGSVGAVVFYCPEGRYDRSRPLLTMDWEPDQLPQCSGDHLMATLLQRVATALDERGALG